MIQAYAAEAAGAELKSFSYDPGPLGQDEVEVEVESCGICHSDLSMLDNEWGITQYPFVAGHEAVGVIRALGSHVSDRHLGQRVGVGWYARSCLTCEQCLSGDHNLCSQTQATIVGHFGGFGDRVRCQSTWAIPLPPELDAATAGPLFCGGITVFNPLVQFDIRPTHRVGVVGVGGLGHLALQFMAAWGCEVTAFSSNPDKTDELKSLGADHVVNSRDPEALKAVAGSLDFILSTVNVSLDWTAYIQALRPKGRLHFVGVVLEPVPVNVFGLLDRQKTLSGSPLGSPATVAQMLRFAAHHSIAPITQAFPFSQVNEALAHLRRGQARYRLILTH
ncbi:MAG: NAD(P)-dependent alcohol dehydrogenase [Gloeomargaritaceae cyanobacterium C42_A2020_066]|nr:NAD(P)-dependent alcohol dehydrogenase [Gloeomargaritaceae cyanobacterium C42_A2020_066]